MQRVAFRMRIAPGSEQEYERRHQQVWPEMLAELKAAGAYNYSIFRDGLQFFAYLEVDDLDRYCAYLIASDTAAKWESFMQDILVREVGPETGFSPLLAEVFHLD